MPWTTEALEALKQDQAVVSPTEYLDIIHWAELFASCDFLSGTNREYAVGLRHFARARRDVIRPARGAHAASR